MILFLLMGPSVLDDGGMMMTISAATAMLLPKKTKVKTGMMLG